MIRTYLDTGVLIAAWRGTEEVANKAMAVLDDMKREFIFSEVLRLEIMPKTLFHKNKEESQFYEEIFLKGKIITWSTASLNRAYEIASRYNLSALDSIHIATALDSKVDEFITTENGTKPMHKVHNLKTISLYTK